MSMNSLERDFGKAEANIEILTKDMKIVKEDLSVIKNALIAKEAVVKSDTARLGLVAVAASIITHAVSWVRPFFT